MNAICIWQPRFHDKKVLVDRLKINKNAEKNYIFFCADRNHPDLYSVDTKKVLSLNSGGLFNNNGTICYTIPLEWLENEGELPKDLATRRDKEYDRFKKSQGKKK